MANVVTYKKLWAPQLITTAEAIIFTAAPASTTGVVKNMSAVICNTSSTGVAVEIWVVPDADAGVTSDKAKLINSEIVPGKGRLSFTVPDMANNDDLIAKAATTNVLSIHSTSGIVIN